MVTEIEPRELSKRLAQKDEPAVLIDVREPEEHALCSIEPSTLIPLMQLPNRLAEVRRISKKGKQLIVLYCRSGQRSALACQFLASQGIENVQNLRGGINAFAVEVDDSITPY